MAEEFAKSVDDGLKLSKRLYFGKDRAVSPPKPPPPMERSLTSYLPTAPMVYAVISNPAIVDNPDIPSYQPHVHGRCDPPALIPLHMNRIDLAVDSFLDTVFVRVSGSWRVHCVMGSKSCDLRVAVPIGDQGSIIGLEVEVPRESYSTELIVLDDKKEMERDARPENGGYLNSNIFFLTIPKVDGGSIISVKVSWMQKVLCSDGVFSIVVPFSFPDYVTPPIKNLAKKEKIQLNVYAGPRTQILCQTTSHPLKELSREAGKLCLFRESEVFTWTNFDFSVSYTVSSSNISGSVLLQSPPVYDIDQRQMFCMYLFPGDKQNWKVFKKEIVFVIDISESMEGKPLEGTKNALSAALFSLSPDDSFNIIAFNGETDLFSSSMELANKETVDRALQWMNMNLIAGGGTNILNPLTQAVEMVSNTRGLLPIIFLVTDGAVEDERHICDLMKSQLTAGGSLGPRIHTFGIGSFCNHYFLRMLAMISRGQYDAALDVDSVETRMQRLIGRGIKSLLADITIETFDGLDEVEVYPSRIPDLSSESPLTVSGRYRGNFSDNLKVKGILGDLSNFAVDLTVYNAKDIPIDRVFAKQHIDLLTAQAWFSEDKQLEEKVAKMSIQTGIASEYTRMTVIENGATESPAVIKLWQKGDKQKRDMQNQRRILKNLCVGFGNLNATAENIPPGAEEPKLPEAAEIIIKAASNCCGSLCNQCCCMRCIHCCSKTNDQCVIALTQLCTALACFGCFECCSDLCCCANENGQ